MTIKLDISVSELLAKLRKACRTNLAEAGKGEVEVVRTLADCIVVLTLVGGIGLVLLVLVLLVAALVRAVRAVS